MQCNYSLAKREGERGEQREKCRVLEIEGETDRKREIKRVKVRVKRKREKG